MDGEVTIGANLVTDKFDRQIANLDKKIEKEEGKKLIIEAKLTSQQSDLEEARKKVDDLAEAYQQMKKLQDTLASGNATPGQFSAFQDLQNTYGSLEQLGASFDKALNKQDAIEQKVAQTQYRYDELNSKVDEYKQKIDALRLEQHQAQVDKLKNGFENVGKSVQNSISKVARLALGIFGLRSAYMAVRRASSELASYDSQYAANINYIRFVLTQAIAPVLRYIVNLAATLLGYINAIVNAWFGINLFGKASAKDFQQMKAGASGTAKAAKEIRKQLAGFDEMNVLNADSDSGGGGGAGGGGAMPSFDLSALNGDVPKWLQWIIDNKDLILAVMAGIAAGLTAWKLGLTGIQSLGIGLAVAGIVLLIQDIIKFIKNPSWEGFLNILRDIALVVAGLALVFNAWAVAAVAAVVFIVVEIIKHWDKVKEILNKVGQWIKDHVITPIKEFFADLQIKILEMLIKLALLINQKVVTPIKQFFRDLWSSVSTFFINAWNGMISKLSQFGSWVYSKVIQPVLNFFNNLWNGVKNGASIAWNFIKSVFSSIGSWFGGIINTIINKFREMGTKAGEVIGGAFRAVVNGVLRVIENVLNTPIRAINGLINTINAVPGINLSRLSTFSLPRLAKGTILNAPGKGTLVGGGSAIAGEAGREAYLPLSDTQLLEELGSTIGRYITINANIVNSMNGRILSKELQKIQNDRDFAYNV